MKHVKKIKQFLGDTEKEINDLKKEIKEKKELLRKKDLSDSCFERYGIAEMLCHRIENLKDAKDMYKILEETDELRPFRSSEESWRNLYGRAGYVCLKNNKEIGRYITDMN